MVVVKYVGQYDTVHFVKWYDKKDWNNYLKELEENESDHFPFDCDVDFGDRSIMFWDFEDFKECFMEFKSDDEQVKTLQTISEGDFYIGNHFDLPQV